MNCRRSRCSNGRCVAVSSRVSVPTQRGGSVSVLTRTGNWFAAALLLFGLLAPAHASDLIPAPPQTKPIALKGATIHPVSAPEIAGGMIVFDKGKITALGAERRNSRGRGSDRRHRQACLSRLDQRKQRPGINRNQRGSRDGRYRGVRRHQSKRLAAPPASIPTASCFRSLAATAFSPLMRCRRAGLSPANPPSSAWMGGRRRK